MPIVLIPARLQSSRLPHKIMADIGGQPMLFHVAERAVAADVGPVIIACDDSSVYRAVMGMGFIAVMTSREHACGTDRIAEALDGLDGEGFFGTIVNVQADVPFIDPLDIRALVKLMDESPCDMGTLCTLDMDRDKMASPHVVKLIGTPLPEPNRLRALYFTRALPWVHAPLYHHIGVYAFRKEALARLRRLPMGTLETAESLEQLRALENGMRIDATIVDRVPISVDTQSDLDRARESFEAANHASKNFRRKDQASEPT